MRSNQIFSFLQIYVNIFASKILFCGQALPALNCRSTLAANIPHALLAQILLPVVGALPLK